MMEAGEASGQLDTVLERLAEHAEKDYALRRKIIGALTYPGRSSFAWSSAWPAS